MKKRIRKPAPIKLTSISIIRVEVYDFTNCSGIKLQSFIPPFEGVGVMDKDARRLHRWLGRYLEWVDSMEGK